VLIMALLHCSGINLSIGRFDSPLSLSVVFPFFSSLDQTAPVQLAIPPPCLVEHRCSQSVLSYVQVPNCARHFPGFWNKCFILDIDLWHILLVPPHITITSTMPTIPVPFVQASLPALGIHTAVLFTVSLQAIVCCEILTTATHTQPITHQHMPARM